MPRKTYPIEIIIKDRINNQEMIIGVSNGIFKKQLLIVATEKNKNKKKRTESFTYLTNLKKALFKKIDYYIKQSLF